MSDEQPVEQPVVEEQPLVVGSPEDMNVGEASAAEEEVPSVEAVEVKENIRIGDQTFEKQEDAWEHANKLAEERLAQDAYRQGMDDALRNQPQVTQPAAEPAQDNFDDEFYSNPQEYLKKYGEKIAAGVKNEIETKQATSERETELWNKFYTNNPDLQVKERLVKSILTENWDVLSRMRDSDEALKILASKTRQELKKWSDAEKPSVELPRTAAQVSSGKGAQINNHQKGRLI